MDGGTISGNTNNNGANPGYVTDSGGVFVYPDGIFTMNGGTISGNTVISHASAIATGGGVSSHGIFTMQGGTISGNTVQGGVLGTAFTCGGGVFIAGGTFTKTNGVITGYGSDTINGNRVTTRVSTSSSIIPNDKGHAVYILISPYKRLENTVTASHNLNSAQSGAAGGWVE
jgi:hypothetical protein